MPVVHPNGNVHPHEADVLDFTVAIMAYVSRVRPAKHYQRLLYTITHIHTNTNQEYLQVSCTLLNLRLRSRHVYLDIRCGNYCFVRSRTVTQTADLCCGDAAYIRRVDLVYHWLLTARAMTYGHTFYIGVLTGWLRNNREHLLGGVTPDNASVSLMNTRDVVYVHTCVFNCGLKIIILLS